MADSISSLGKPAVPAPARTTTPAGEKSTATPTTSSVGGGDSVMLTDTARQLQALTAAADATELVDSGRVGEIRQAIADGQYTIDSRQIAENLLQFDN